MTPTENLLEATIIGEEGVLFSISKPDGEVGMAIMPMDDFRYLQEYFSRGEK